MTTYGPTRKYPSASVLNRRTEKHFCHEQANLPALSTFETYGTVVPDKSGKTHGTGWRTLRKTLSQLWDHVGTGHSALEPHTFEHTVGAPEQGWTGDVPVANPQTSRSSTAISRDSPRILIHKTSCSAAKAHPGVLVFCGECEVHVFTQEQDPAVDEEQDSSEKGAEMGGRGRKYGSGRGWGEGWVVDAGKEWVVQEREVERRNIDAWVLWFRRKVIFS